MNLLDPSRQEQLGRTLRSLRKAAGLTHTTIAAELGVAQSTISRLESGKALPSPDHLDRWAAATGATTEQRLHLDALAQAAAAEKATWQYRPSRLVELQT